MIIYENKKHLVGAITSSKIHPCVARYVFALLDTQVCKNVANFLSRTK